MFTKYFLGLSISACLPLSLNAQTIPYEGLPHTALGQAQLDNSTGQLVVSNIGSSGQDGVRIDLGEAQFHTVMFQTPPAQQLPAGSSMNITTMGSLNGVPEQEIWRLRVRDVGGRFGASLDTSIVQSGYVRVEARLDGNVVDSVLWPNGGPPVGQDVAFFINEGCFIDPFWPIDDECWLMLAVETAGPISLLGGADQVIADEIVFASGQQQNSVDSLSATVMQTNMPNFLIMDEALGMYCLPHHSVGQAQMQTAGGRLRVSNLGSSGCDGVSIDLGGSDTHLMRYEAAPASVLPTGSYIDMTTFGTLSGQEDVEIWTLRIADVGDVFGASLDTSIVQSGNLCVTVYDDGGGIVDIGNFDPTIIDFPFPPIVTFPPQGCEVDPFQPLSGECIASIELGDTGPAPAQMVQIQGHAPVFGCRIVIASSNQQNSVESLSRTQILTGGGITDFTILDESLVVEDPTPYCSPKPSSAGCLASIGVDGAGQPVSGASDYSVTGIQIQGFKNGLVIASLSGGAAIPFNGGTLCVQPPTKRGPIINSGGSSPGACDGFFSTMVNDGNVIPLGLDAGAGNSAWYQYWLRDPGNGSRGLGTALSNGIRLDFQ